MSGFQPDANDEIPDETAEDSLPGAEADASQEPEYVTRADFEAFTQQVVDKISRQVQSQTDRVDRNRQARFNGLMSAFQRAADQAVAQGFIQPGQKDAYTRMLRDDAMHQAVSGGQQAPLDQADEGEEEIPPAEDADPSVESINTQGEVLARNLGLAEGDPELGGIIADGTPEEFYASIKAAARIKAQRLGGHAPVGRQPARPGASPARSPAVGAGAGRTASNNPVENIESSEALYDLAWKQIKQKGR